MIDKNLYIHPLEEELYKEMMDSTYFSEEIMDYYKNFDEKLRKPDLLGKTVKVTQKQFKEVYDIAQEIAEINDMSIPNIYVYEDFYYGVESNGSDDPWIEISAKTLMDFTRDEITFLIGREMCNIKLKHTYYSTLIDETLKAMEQHNIIVGMETLSKSLKVIMYKWSRISNYTADCFGYLMCRNLKACVNAILKLILNNIFLVENIDVAEYISQVDFINELDDSIYSFTKMDELIPYGPFRIKNLLAYASSERGIRGVKEILDIH